MQIEALFSSLDCLIPGLKNSEIPPSTFRSSVELLDIYIAPGLNFRL